MARRAHFISCSGLLLALLSLSCPRSLAEVVPFMDLGFLFDYNVEGQAVPIPVTEQCERIHIKWARRDATGPNPVAPYYLMIFTSAATAPFKINAGSGLQFDWDVPFAPGTMYQICMFDKNGVSGGCQDKYTMIKNSTVNNPTCQNVTTQALDVDASVNNGPMSQFGFIPQCTELSVKPLQGSPPYTLLIAPSLHPPYKIVSDSRDSINWTVTLSRSFPFFVSLASSEGFMWSFGPEHSGAGSDDCLVPGAITQKKAKKLAASAGVGGLFGGLIFGVAATAFFLWYRARRAATQHTPLASRPASLVADNLPSSAEATVEEGRSRQLLSMLQRMRPGQAGGIVIQPYPGTITSSQPTDPVTVTSPSAILLRSTSSLTYVHHRDAASETASSPIIDLPPEYMDRRASTYGSLSSVAPSSDLLTPGSRRQNSTSPRVRKL